MNTPKKEKPAMTSQNEPNTKEPIVKDRATEGENMNIGLNAHDQVPEERVVEKHPELTNQPVDSWPDKFKPDERPLTEDQLGDIETMGSKVSPKRQSDLTASGRIPKSGVEGEASNDEEEQHFHAIPGEGGVYETLPNGRTRKVE